MSATAAPPRLILMLSAPLEDLAVELAEVLAAVSAAVEVAATRVDGTDMETVGLMMEELLYGEPVE
jgi:hypothetical protein